MDTPEDILLREFEEYLDGQHGERLRAYKPRPPPKKPEDAEEPDAEALAALLTE